jgi:hypothetical protein
MHKRKGKVREQMCRTAEVVDQWNNSSKSEPGFLDNWRLSPNYQEVGMLSCCYGLFDYHNAEGEA